MTRDATLDAFADATSDVEVAEDRDDGGGGHGSVDAESGYDDGDGKDGESENVESGAGEFGGDEVTDDSAAESAVDVSDPVSTTTEWSPAGAACASCGTVVERLWRQDGDLLCPDCKDWDDA